MTRDGRRFALLLAMIAAGALGGAPSIAPAGPRAEDLAVARSGYVLKSPVFTAAARERAVHFIDASVPRADAMTPEQFLLCILRIAAFADNGHDTEHDAGDAWWPAARLPVRMLWFPEEWVIARADAANADLLGARVLSIDGRSARELFAGLREYWGGLDRYRRWNLEPAVIEQAGMLYAAGLARRADRLELQVQLPDGRRVHRTLQFVAKSSMPPGQIFERLWSPAAWPGDAEKGWTSFQPPVTPLYLQEGARVFRVARLAELDALFVQMRVHFDADGETVEDLRRRAEEIMQEKPPRHLIVDLRFDTGGDIDLTRDWQRSLAARVPGQIYVLVSPHTFSAGIVSAAAFKHDAPGRVQVVGEAVGDRLRWWSEGDNVCMPHSHYCLHMTTGLWDLVHGCAAHPACYGDRYEAQVADLDPDLAAPISAGSWLAGRDPGMEAIARSIESAATRTRTPQ
ncbi:MAG: hypothetical protein JSR36_14770 [Proteobacteria bacterium]|nr:hypothetical protein [Pseudomonadota bacterium]